MNSGRSLLKNGQKYLANQDDLLQPINSSLTSGIFSRTTYSENKVSFDNIFASLLNSKSNCQIYDDSTDSKKSHDETTITESSRESGSIANYEFLQPKPQKNKEAANLNLVNYFKRFTDERPKLLQSLNEEQNETLRKISADASIANKSGNLTFKLNESNEMEKVVYYNPAQSKRIDYFIPTPESMGLVKSKSLYQETESTSTPKSTVKRKVGRPRNIHKRPIEETEDSIEIDATARRTKFGRITKLNSNVAKIYEVEQHTNASTEPSSFVSNIPQKMILTMPDNLSIPQDKPIQNALSEPPKRKRKISSEFRCSTCQKIYLGKNKMNQHYKLNPNHKPIKSECDSVLFTHLMGLVRQKKTNNEMAQFFVKELSMFLEKIQKLTPKLITSNEIPNSFDQMIDKNAAVLLRINPGEYKLNMNVFDKTFKLDNPIEQQQITDHQEDTTIHHDDQIKKSLDDVRSLDGTEVNLLIRGTNELTNLTNISDLVDTEKISDHQNDDNAIDRLGCNISF
ncbi:unnamed protein product [Diamesa tonsa]